MAFMKRTELASTLGWALSDGGAAIEAGLAEESWIMMVDDSDCSNVRAAIAIDRIVAVEQSDIGNS